jgi:uncharacterized protein YjdB
MQIQRIIATVTPNILSVPAGQTRVITLGVDLVGGRSLNAVQIGSLIDQEVITFQWDNAAPGTTSGVWSGAVGDLERTGLNTFRFTSTNLGYDARNRTDRLTYTLTDANQRRFTAVLNFSAPQFIAATGITRVIPDQITMFVGQSVQLQAILTPNNTTETAQWSSRPSGLVSVSVTGLATALAPGLATITARIESGVTVDVPVQVFRGPNDIIVDPISVILTPGSHATVSMMTFPPNVAPPPFVQASDSSLVRTAVSGSTITITALADLEFPDGVDVMTTTVRVAMPGISIDASPTSLGRADIQVEVRRTTGVTAQLVGGPVMFSGERRTLALTIPDPALQGQRFYLEVAACPLRNVGIQGIPASLVGSQNVSYGIDDIIQIQAHSAGIGVARIRLFTTLQTPRNPVGELHVVVAPDSPRGVSFRHEGTVNTWYPGSLIGDTRLPPSTIPDSAQWGRILTMQTHQSVTVRPRINEGNDRLETPIAWSSTVSNQHREALYFINVSTREPALDGTPTGPITTPTPPASPTTIPEREHLYLLDSSGRYIRRTDGRTDIGNGFYRFIDVFMEDIEFREYSENPTGATGRIYGFFQRDIPLATRMALLRSGGVERQVSQLLPNPIPITDGATLSANSGVPTGLAAVSISPMRFSIEPGAPTLPWRDLFYAEVDLFTNVGGVLQFNPLIAPQTGIELEQRTVVGGVVIWERVTSYPINVPVGTTTATLTSIYDVRPTMTAAGGPLRLVDINGSPITHDSVSVVQIGDPRAATNSFYVRVLPGPLTMGMPQLANHTERVIWQNPSPTSLSHRWRELAVIPGSGDVFEVSQLDVGNIFEQPTGYPRIDAFFVGARPGDNIGITHLPLLGHILVIDIPFPPVRPTLPLQFIYTIGQVSRLGFAPILGDPNDREIAVTSPLAPLYYTLHMDPPAEVIANAFPVPIGSTNIDLRTTALLQEVTGLTLGSVLLVGGVDQSNAEATAVSPIPAGISVTSQRYLTVTADAALGSTFDITFSQGGNEITLRFRVVASGSQPASPASIIIGSPEPITLSTDNNIIAAARSAGIDLGTATFESTDASILTIDDRGVATPRRAGRVGVRIRSRDGSRSVTVTIEIQPAGAATSTSPTATPTSPAATPTSTPTSPPRPPLTAVRLRTTAGVAVGMTMTLEPFVTPFNADRTLLKWSSSDATVATVEGGVVTGLKAGTARITVTCENGTITAVCTVTVRVDTRPVTAITLNRRTLNLNAGANSTLSVTFRPSNATIRGVTWTSDNPAVARVEPNGRVIGVSGGTAVITAVSDSGAHIASCTVTVRVPVTSVTLPETRITLTVGETYQIEPVINPSNATDTTATYTTRASATATVSSTGLVTARRAGTTTITVRVDGRTTTLNVTVVR